MNLYTILGQDTLPEQVEKNKQNIAILAEEVDKLGFTPKGVYDADTEYNYNDLVFYDEKMYAVISEVAIVGVLPTNTTYWQQVTGSIMGQQGPQGIQGPQGPAGADGQDGQDGTNGTDGTDGVDALVYTAINSFYNMGVGSIIQLANAYFNRTPVLGEKPVVYAVDSGNGHKYLLTGSISNVGSSASSYMIGSLTQIDGLQGAEGQAALCYDRNIAFTRTEDAEQLISVTLPFANFNRDPELNQDFVAILEDTGVCYIAQCEVQSISGTNVTSIVASDINRITGADGQNGTNGTNGTDGKDALVYGGTVSASIVSTPYTFTTSNFNRTPVVDDIFIVNWKETSTNKSYLCVYKVTSVSSSQTIATWVSQVETTGAAGAGSQLYMHCITISKGGYNCYVNFINNTSTAYTATNGFRNALGAMGINDTTSPASYLNAMGSYNSSGTFYYVIGFTYTSGGYLGSLLFNPTTGETNSTTDFQSSATLVDKVVTL